MINYFSGNEISGHMSVFVLRILVRRREGQNISNFARPNVNFHSHYFRFCANPEYICYWFYKHHNLDPLGQVNLSTQYSLNIFSVY